MIRIFRTNQVIGIFFILIYVILIRSSGFFSNFSWEITSPGILGSWLHELINPTSLIAKISSLVIVFIEAVLLNVVINNHRLSSQNTYIPAAIYVLICSYHPSFLMLSAPLIANFFIILGINELIGIYKKYLPASQLFNMGLFFSIASLFYFSYIYYVPFLILGIQILRAFKIKEVLMMLSGFFVPYFFLIIYLFWFDQLPMIWTDHFVKNIGFLDAKGIWEIQRYVTLGIFGFLLLWILLNTNEYFLKKKIQVQKYFSIFFWLILFAGITFIFQAGLRLDHLTLLAIPFSLFLTENLIKLSPPVADSIHFLLLFGLFFLHYYYFVTTGVFGLS